MLSFKNFLLERVLSIGLNPDHERFRDQHRNEIHDMIRKSYSPIGGYAGFSSGSEEESKAIHSDISNSVIKAVKRDGKITALNLYKKQHGRKSIASATDGSDQGKKDYLKTKLEDHEQKRAWGEVSGAVEHISKKLGVPGIPSSRAQELLGKEVDKDPEDEYHYTRKIGGTFHRKMMVGHPKTEG